jgi:hypothetical protein
MEVWGKNKIVNFDLKNRIFSALKIYNLVMKPWIRIRFRNWTQMLDLIRIKTNADLQHCRKL